VVDEAHERGVQVEGCPIMVKHAWEPLREVLALPAGSGRGELLGRVVMVIIQEYYEQPER
jgi:hypothetical protein